MNIAEYKKMDVLEKSHWWFRAKRDFFSIILKKYIGNAGNAKGFRVLDVGCGTGGVMEFLRENEFIVEGVDMSDDALAYCRAKGLSVQKGTAEELPYADALFDIIIASDVIEHVEHDSHALAEMNRVLKPGGYCLITVPAHQFLFSYHDVALHHFRRYSRARLRRAMEPFFELKEVSWIHAGILLPAMFIRLLWRGRKAPSGPRPMESDVRQPFFLVNVALRGVYVLERLWFRVFRLPWGLSLFGVGIKK